MGPYEQGLERNDANYTVLAPVSFLAKAASVYPDRVAVIHGAVRRTWRQVYERSRRLASALAKRGVKRGDTVAAMLPNVPAMVELHFGPAMFGAVLNTLNTRLDAEAIAFMLDHGEAKGLFTDPEFAPIIGKALKLVKTRPLVIDVADALYEVGAPVGDLEYESILAPGDPGFEWKPPPEAMMNGMAKCGFDITHVYGLTEPYGPAAVCAKHPEWGSLPVEEQVKLNGRQGVAYLLEEGMSVLDPETMRAVPWDGETMGEIMFRGNITMKGYLKNPAASAEAFAGGGFPPGDLAGIQAAGYRKSKDRPKERTLPAVGKTH